MTYRMIFLGLLAGVVASCASSGESEPQSIRLSSSTVALRGGDTTRIIEASLVGASGCMMQNMYSTGDTSIICFRLLEDSNEHPMHHICITAMPGLAQRDTSYTCTIHFTMQGPMTYMHMRMGAGQQMDMNDMMGYPATVTVSYRR